jgi:hypothetical protein
VTLKQERIFIGLVLYCVCLQLAQAVHNAWFSYAVSQSNPTNVSILFARPTVSYAPQAYRLALPAMIRLVASIFHIKDRSYVAAAFDLIAGFLALYLLYWLRVSVLPERTKIPTGRMLFILFFLTIIQFPLAWVVPRLRAETMPSSLFLSVSLFSVAKMMGNRAWLLVLLVATLCQAFVRADIPFVFGISLVLVELWSYFHGRREASGFRAMAGGLVILISGTIQAYLQFVRLPHLSYAPHTEVIQLISNLTIHNLEIFIIALLPYLGFFVFWIIKRPFLNHIETVIIVASLLYLPLWFTVGSISEVRIYVPFLLALSMVVARVSATFVSRETGSAS